MGLSASQARLLTITARLTSNEYESQQISNAKMRLATQSQEASQEYIAALNGEELSFISFDNNGNSVKTPLTVNAMYEYNDTKNQYLLTNSAGKALLSSQDIKNYEASNNLEDFLSKYGLKKIFKSQTLNDAYNDLKVLSGYTTDGKTYSDTYNSGYDYKKAYDDAAKTIRSGYSKAAWITDKNKAQLEYMAKKSAYQLKFNQQRDGKDITNEEVEEAQIDMEITRAAFLGLVSYETAIENRIKTSNPTEYENYQKYKSALALYNDELDNEGATPASAYSWDDKTKAQWYTNLWYKINGCSTGNMHTNNYVQMDNKMMSSTAWVSDSIIKGNVHLEAVTYTGQEMTLKGDIDPFIFNLNGIEWNAKIFSTCTDIVTSDNNKKIAQAEAEYQRRTAEINAKDEKYQRKLSLLDSEHHAIQTEYESVKSAMDKNIGRSFKAFQG